MNDPQQVRQAMKEAKRTQVAQSAVELADYFNQLFSGVRVSGDCPRRPTMVAPEGMSTAGGRQARQSIVLTPEYAGFAVVTVGFADLGTRAAELRTFSCLEAMHRQRFAGRPFGVEPATYQAFFAQAQQVIASRGFVVRVQDKPPPAMRDEDLGEVVEPGFSTSAVMGISSLFFFLGIAAGAAATYVLMSR